MRTRTTRGSSPAVATQEGMGIRPDISQIDVRNERVTTVDYKRKAHGDVGSAVLAATVHTLLRGQERREFEVSSRPVLLINVL